jgi:uncharacterized protein YbaA (DUF1428 family)
MDDQQERTVAVLLVDDEASNRFASGCDHAGPQGPGRAGQVSVSSLVFEPGAQMPYIEGFVAAVPTANKEKYIEHAREATAYFKSLGATRIVECWGDDVPKGEVTDFYKAVQAKEDETVIFSWIEYPDKATRDAANEKMAADFDTDMEMPFDSKRMFWGGFEPVVSE